MSRALRVDRGDALPVGRFDRGAGQRGQVGPLETWRDRRCTRRDDQPDELANRIVRQRRPRVGVYRVAQHHPDHRQQRLAALQIAAEPEEIVGDAAWQRAGVAADMFGIGSREQRYRRDRIGTVNADVGGPAALAQHCRARVGVLADPREAAGQHRPAVLRRARREHAQGERTGGKRVVEHHRHRRKPHYFLSDVILRPPRDVGEQRVAFRADDLAAWPGNRVGETERCRRECRTDQQSVEILAEDVQGFFLATPPCRDIGQRQVSARQPRCQRRQKSGERR